MASVMVKVLHFPEPLSAFYSWKIIQLSQEAIKKLPNAFLKEDWQQQINTEVVFNWLWLAFPEAENKRLPLSPSALVHQNPRNT